MWRRLVAAGSLFERELQPAPPASTRGVPMPPMPCLHSWLVRVEAVDAKGAVRQRTESACGGGLAVRFAFDLAREAVAAIPACALLDAEKTRNDVTRLAECSMLEGDRQAAAEGLNAYNTTWFANPRGPDFARVLQYLFDDQATFEWPGVPAVSGSTAAAIEWTTRGAKSRFLPRRIIGEDADRVRIEGRIFDLDGAAESPRAGHPATMIWTRRNGFGFRLASFRPGTGG